jgi:uridine phosphorylase
MSNTPTLGKADLLRNADGSVYHLAIPFGVLPKTIITVGDPDRVEVVSRCFDAIEHKFSKREFVTHIGRLGSNQVAVVSTGIGTDNIDIALQELDFLVNINPITGQVKEKLSTLHMVRIGTTGALRPDFLPGSAIVSHGATGFDTLMQFYDIPAEFGQKVELDVEMQKALGLDFTPYSTHATWGMLNAAAARFAQPGHTATCPGFYGPQSRITRLGLRHSMLDNLEIAPYRSNLPFTNFEMETAGIFALGALQGHCTASISLVVANRATGKVSSHADMQMEALIEDVLSILF